MESARPILTNLASHRKRHRRSETMRQNDWSDHGDAGDGPPDEQSWLPEIFLGDPDAWRGDTNVPLDEASWRGTLQSSPDDDGWRGTEHGEEWPEWNAGPE